MPSQLAKFCLKLQFRIYQIQMCLYNKFTIVKTFMHYTFQAPMQFQHYPPPLPMYKTLQKCIKFNKEVTEPNVQLGQLSYVDLQQFHNETNHDKFEKTAISFSKKNISRQWYQQESGSNKAKLIELFQMTIKYIKNSKNQRYDVLQAMRIENEKYQKELKQKKKYLEKKKQHIYGLKQDYNIKKEAVKQYRYTLQNLPRCTKCKKVYKNEKSHNEKYHIETVIQKGSANETNDNSIKIMKEMLLANQQYLAKMLEKQSQQTVKIEDRSNNNQLMEEMKRQIQQLRIKLNEFQLASKKEIPSFNKIDEEPKLQKKLSKKNSDVENSVRSRASQNLSKPPLIYDPNINSGQSGKSSPIKNQPLIIEEQAANLYDFDLSNNLNSINPRNKKSNINTLQSAQIKTISQNKKYTPSVLPVQPNIHEVYDSDSKISDYLTYSKSKINMTESQAVDEDSFFLNENVNMMESKKKKIKGVDKDSDPFENKNRFPQAKDSIFKSKLKKEAVFEQIQEQHDDLEKSGKKLSRKSSQNKSDRNIGIENLGVESKVPVKRIADMKPRKQSQQMPQIKITPPYLQQTQQIHILDSPKSGNVIQDEYQDDFEQESKDKFEFENIGEQSTINQKNFKKSNPSYQKTAVIPEEKEQDEEQLISKVTKGSQISIIKSYKNIQEQYAEDDVIDDKDYVEVILEDSPTQKLKDQKNLKFPEEVDQIFQSNKIRKVLSPKHTFIELDENQDLKSKVPEQFKKQDIKKAGAFEFPHIQMNLQSKILPKKVRQQEKQDKKQNQRQSVEQVVEQVIAQDFPDLSMDQSKKKPGQNLVSKNALSKQTKESKGSNKIVDQRDIASNIKIIQSIQSYETQNCQDDIDELIQKQSPKIHLTSRSKGENQLLTNIKKLKYQRFVPNQQQNELVDELLDEIEKAIAQEHKSIFNRVHKTKQEQIDKTKNDIATLQRILLKNQQKQIQELKLRGLEKQKRLQVIDNHSLDMSQSDFKNSIEFQFEVEKKQKKQTMELQKIQQQQTSHLKKYAINSTKPSDKSLTNNNVMKKQMNFVDVDDPLEMVQSAEFKKFEDEDDDF